MCIVNLCKKQFTKNRTTAELKHYINTSMENIHNENTRMKGH